MEELTKTQLILLALLVSFVTSIATGIVTITLINQAPTDVVRTINRVVEHTVEKVVPGETKIIERIRESGPTESDLLALAVKKHSDALLLVKVDKETATFHSGVSISPEGLILTSSEGIVKGEVYELVWDGANVSTSTILTALADTVDETTGLAFLKVQKSVQSKAATTLAFISTGSANISYPYVSLTGADAALGEKVFAIAETEDAGTAVRIGNVTGLKPGSASSTPLVLTSIDNEATIAAAPVLDLSANLIGIYMGAYAGNHNVALPGSYITSHYKTLFASAPSAADNTASVSNAVTTP